jgi:Ni/Fe-hydrogenase subunit HybB-like protein
MHGLVMFAWVGLFLTQVALIVCHRPLWHRRLGVIGMAVALLVVGLGVPTSITAARLGGDHLPAGLTPPQFLASALTSLAAFALLAGSGLALRRRPAFHKRLMLLSNIPPLIAVFARLIFFLHLNVGITTLRNLLLLAFIVIDTMRTRRLHPALAGGSAFLVAADAGANMLAGTAAWAGIVRTLTA